jgi:hypothetical protein
MICFAVQHFAAALSPFFQLADCTERTRQAHRNPLPVPALVKAEKQLDGNSCKRRSPLFSGGLQLTSSARRSGLATACGLVNATIRGLSRSDVFEPNFRSATT